MPEYVEALFKTAGKDIKNYFEYEKLDIVCNYFWEDGVRLSAFSDQKKFGAEVEKKLNISADGLHKALKDSRRKYELTGNTFLHHSLHKAKTWFTKEVANSLLHLPSLHIFKSMNQVNEHYLKHPKLVQLFNRYATYNGSNPFKAPGILNIIPHLEHSIGAFFPKGGMASISQSIFKLAKDLGVQFHFNQRVDEIIVKEKVALGIRIADHTILFDRVISNMDIFFTYRTLLPQEKHPENILKQKKSTSALIFYWGIQKTFDELTLHNILFSKNYKREFEHLAHGHIDEDPTVYINISQKYQSSDAPTGCENWFTMINVPHNNGQDWDSLIATARKNIIAKINRSLQTDIEPLILNESILDPRSIESKTASHLGALYGTSSDNRLAAFFRHANFSRRLKNLYFCGGSVHPGGGIPLCLLSAKILDELMHE